VENGLGGDIFDMPHSAITWTTHTWLKNTLIRFEDSTMSISHTLPQLTLWKDNDVFLIERFIKAKQFSSSQMTILNEIRMYLKVSTLSDITTSDGTRFLTWALRAEPHHSCSSQRYKWPATATLSRKHKELWRSALRMAFARQTVNLIDLTLVTNVWLSIAQPFLKWWYSRLTQSLYMSKLQMVGKNGKKTPHKVEDQDKQILVLSQPQHSYLHSKKHGHR